MHRVTVSMHKPIQLKMLAHVSRVISIGGLKNYGIRSEKAKAKLATS